MKIQFNVNKVISAYGQNSKKEKINNKNNLIKDRIDISDEGREIAKYIDSAKDIDIKNKRVDDIKMLIKQNSYYVNSEELSKSILKQMKDSD